MKKSTTPPPVVETAAGEAIPSETPTQTAPTSAAQGAISSPAPSPTPPFGRINFSPDLDVAFLPVCSAAPAGAGAHSGYSVSFGHNAQIGGGSMRVPDYAGADGTYQESTHLISSNPTFSISLTKGTLAPAKDSYIFLTIRKHGLEGFAQLGNFRLNGNSVIVGTITWACSAVKR